MLPCVAVKKGRPMIYWHASYDPSDHPTFFLKSCRGLQPPSAPWISRDTAPWTWIWLIQKKPVDALSWRSRNLIFWEVSHINAASLGPSKLQVTRKRLLLPSDFDAAEAIERNSLHTDPRIFLFVYIFLLLGRLMTLMTGPSDVVVVVLSTLGESVCYSFTPSHHENSCAKVLLWDWVHSWKCSNRPCGRWLLWVFAPGLREPFLHLCIWGLDGSSCVCLVSDP